MSDSVLVTGGAGFLGSHLCHRLLQNGLRVVALDSLLTGTMANIRPLQQDPNFSFIHGDVCNPITFETPFSSIYHLACPASPIHYQADPLLTTRTCVLGALNVLDRALKDNATVLLASTSEVYGDPLCHPQREDYWGNVNPIGLRSCYNEGKRCSESLFFDAYRQYGAKIKIARIFNTYGPRMLPNDGRVVSNFIIQALSNKPLSAFGDGSQTRSFCYVDDLISGLIALMRSPPAITGPINIGNPSEITIAELASIVISLCQSSSQVEFLELPDDDPKLRRPDITLARNTLQWEPKIPLKQGLLATIAYFRYLCTQTHAH